MDARRKIPVATQCTLEGGGILRRASTGALDPWGVSGLSWRNPQRPPNVTRYLNALNAPNAPNALDAQRPNAQRHPVDPTLPGMRANAESIHGSVGSTGGLWALGMHCNPHEKYEGVL